MTWWNKFIILRGKNGAVFFFPFFLPPTLISRSIENFATKSICKNFMEIEISLLVNLLLNVKKKKRKKKNRMKLDLAANFSISGKFV